MAANRWSIRPITTWLENPLWDYQGEPIGNLGLVFFNQPDQTVQAVVGDGSGVIIINEVTVDQADALHQYIMSLTPDPAALTLEPLKQVLAYAQVELGLGDMYNSEHIYVKENMSTIDIWKAEIADATVDLAYGFKKRDDRDISHAIYIPGHFQFQRDSLTTPQLFEAGGVIVLQAGGVRGVQPDIFIRTYSFSDGQPITEVSQLATQTPF
jgi:hypothetical protein